jgi:hypothetical protein
MIGMGARGLSPIKKLLMGSVSSHGTTLHSLSFFFPRPLFRTAPNPHLSCPLYATVLSNAACPVLVVK